MTNDINDRNFEKCTFIVDRSCWCFLFYVMSFECHKMGLSDFLGGRNFVRPPKKSILSVEGLSLTYTRKSCHFRSQKESDNEAQDKNRARV